MYLKLGCSKQDISYWNYNPGSTKVGINKNKKLSVIRRASVLFGLTEEESEALANKAGLSLYFGETGLVELLYNYTGKYRDLLDRASVSERMFQYYRSGRVPTKQALLAITISLGLSSAVTEHLLNNYGYCLSKSLPEDAVVRWFIENQRNYCHDVPLLFSINEALYELGLPLLMTKTINR